MLEQHLDAVAKQVDRGLEARREHQTGSGLQLAVVEPTAFIGRLDELAQQVVPGVSPQLLQVVGQPVVEADDAPVYLPVLPPRQPDVEARGAQLAEREDLLAVLIGHAEDVSDHRDRKLRAVALDDVDGAGTVRQIVEQHLGGLFDTVPQCGDGAAGEHRRHQLAVAGVFGRFDATATTAARADAAARCSVFRYTQRSGFGRFAPSSVTRKSSERSRSCAIS